MPVTVYLERDNTITLKLKQDGSTVEENTVTKASLWIPNNAFGDGESKTVDTDSENMSLVDNATNIKLELGSLQMNPGNYRCYLTVFDPINVNGIAWEVINLNVRSWRV